MRKLVAPYVETDSSMLGDKHLNPEEAVCRERESLLKEAAKRKIVGQAELEHADRSAGPRLFYTEIIRRLKALNPRLQFRDGMPGHVAIYRPKRETEYNWSEFDASAPRDTMFFFEHVYVTGMPKDWLPEYSHVELDTSKLPVREIRGWRSVLIALIRAGAFTRAAVDAVFGDPFGDARSGRWFEQVGKIK